MRRGSNNRETPKRVPSSKNNRQLVTCRPFRDSCMRTKPNSYRHGSYRLGRVYRQGSKTLFHAYGPSWALQRAANALTAGNLPASIFSLTPSTMSPTGARASAGHEIQTCLCGLLSLRALQLKGQWGTASRQKFSHLPTLHNYCWRDHALACLRHS